MADLNKMIDEAIAAKEASPEHARAQRYAAAVTEVLKGNFPALRDDKLGRIAPEEIAEHAYSPTRLMELILDYRREWRLHQDDVRGEPWRVRVGCHKDHWTEADIRFSDSVNARLRAIELED